MVKPLRNNILVFRKHNQTDEHGIIMPDDVVIRAKVLEVGEEVKSSISIGNMVILKKWDGIDIGNDQMIVEESNIVAIEG